MSEDNKSDESLTDEFRALGENIIDSVRAAWDTPERKRLQQEIEDGLTEMATTIQTEAESFHESPTGQRLKSDIEGLQQWVQSSNAENQIREELINALKTANTELKKVTDKLSGADTTSEEPYVEQTGTSPAVEED